jgi:hypothetical protein
MEEDNNNLGDFFRKRLSSLEGGDEDWFNPDPRADDMVLKGLVASSKEKRSRKKWIFILLPLLLFFGMLGYIAHLKCQIALLNNTATKILAQKKSTPHTSTTINETTTTLTIPSIPKIITTNKKTLETPTNKTDFKSNKQEAFWSTLEMENQALKRLINQKDKKIEGLKLELSQNCNWTSFATELAVNTKPIEFKRLFPSFKTQSIRTNEEKTSLGSKNLFLEENLNDFLPQSIPIGLDGIQNFNNLATIKPRFLDIPLEETEPASNATFSLRKKKKRKAFEVGLHVGVEFLITEKDISISNQRILLKEGLVAAAEFAAPYVGFNIAYSPMKNLWIRTGVQGGGNTDNLREEIIIVYNDAQEYILPSGDRGSDLELNTSTGYTRIDKTLELTVPTTTTNGDLLELEYEEELKIKQIQIPLMVEYFFGSRKWQPFIHFGTKWSLFHYEWKSLKANIESDNQAIDFNLNEGLTNAKTFQYMSLMTGVGLNYNLRSGLSIRTTLGFEANYLLNKTKTTIDYTTSGFFANFGLYYKF